MSDKLSAADAKWVKDAQAEFIERVDGKEIRALRTRVAELEASRDEWTNAAVQRGLELEDMRESNAALRTRVAELEAALEVLYEEADGFSVSGVYFNEPCMGHKGLAMARAALAEKPRIG